MNKAARLPEGKGRRVLITRPEPAASKTATILAEAGFVPLLLPLTRTVPLDFKIGADSFDILTVTSANAFRHIDAHVLQTLRDYPLFVVGEGTATAAKKSGFINIVEGGGDAERLAASLEQQAPTGARILYLAGRIRQSLFEDRVAAAGLTMHVCEVYDTAAIAYSVLEIQAQLGAASLDAVMLYSGVVAHQFADLAHHMSSYINADTRFLCISPRVADKLPAAWQKQALVADHPDEKGLFHLFNVRT